MKDSPVILAPVHRSYADFILVSYVLRACGIPIPAIVAGQGNVVNLKSGSCQLSV